MLTLTSIGVIDAKQKHHIDFVTKALEHLQQEESALAYELWKEKELELALYSARRADMYILQMMYLKHTKHSH